MVIKNARGAKPALQTMAFDKGFLQWVHVSGYTQAFDGANIMSIRLNCKNKAGTGGQTIKDNRACAANTMFAANMSTGKPQFMTDKIAQEHSRINRSLVKFAINSY